MYCLFSCSLTQGEFSLSVLSSKHLAYMDTRKLWNDIFKVFECKKKPKKPKNLNT